MDRQWKLGEDVSTYDAILDPVTFDDIILALHHNRNIDEFGLREIAKDIIRQRIDDFDYLLNNNIDEIIAEAKKGRE